MAELLIGTYTRSAAGPTGAEGIYRCTFDPGRGAFGGLRRAARADNPSFLVRAGGHVLAVCEAGDFGGPRGSGDGGGGGGGPGEGSVRAWRLAGGGDPSHGDGPRLEPVAAIGTGGADPCHLAVAGDRLLVTNYNGPPEGAGVTLFSLHGGVPVGVAAGLRLHGSGPHRRQQAPHPHGAWAMPGTWPLPATWPRPADAAGPAGWAVTDLGCDCVRLLGPDGDERDRWTLPPGSGPRHLQFAHDRAYLVHELANRVDALDASGRVRASASTLPATRVGAAWAASIAVHPGGLRLYVSNRTAEGDDSIATFGLDPDDAGVLEPRGHHPSGGGHPRHFIVLAPVDGPGWLLVANRDGGSQGRGGLVAIRLDAAGDPVATVARIDCPAPVALLAL